MQIGELSELTGCPTKTLRYWEEIGLLPKPERAPNGYRDYDGEAVRIVGFIRAAKSARFRLDDIAQILRIRSAGSPPCSHVTALLSHRLSEVEQKLQELTLVRDDLAERLKVAEAFDPATCTEDAICSLVW
jgi:DNA-binding transcriptional MerR regulator